MEAPKIATRNAAIKLSTPSRITAFVLGLAGLGAGGAAVFMTHLEAGPVGLLVVGLIFMIIGLSGTLPTRLKVGENEAEWQAVAGEVIEVAVEASSPAARANLIDQLGSLAEVAPQAASPALSGIAYEQLIQQMIRDRLHEIPDVRTYRTFVATDDMGEFDGIMELINNRTLLIEIKASRRPSRANIAMVMGKVALYKQRTASRTALLLVSKYDISIAAALPFAQDPDASYVVVRDREDEDELISAIRRTVKILRYDP